MGVSVVLQPPDMAERLKKKIGGSMPDVMRKASVVMRNEIVGVIDRGVPPPNAPLTADVKGGARTLRDNGELMGSIAAHSGSNWASAGTNKRQARILQDGGTITGRGKGLWLPANANTRRLYRKYNAQAPGELISAMRKDGYSFFRTGKVFCARKKRGEPFALFIIKNQVTIPARPFVKFTDGAKKAVKKLGVDAIKAALADK